MNSIQVRAHTCLRLGSLHSGQGPHIFVKIYFLTPPGWCPRVIENMFTCLAAGVTLVLDVLGVLC